MQSGDIIRVINSTKEVAPGNGNGYGDWNLSWTEWRSRSALRPRPRGAPGAVRTHSVPPLGRPSAFTHVVRR